MAIHFAPRLAHHGFDGATTPKWQMVPVGGERTLTLSRVAKLVPRVFDPTIVEAVQTTSGKTTTLKLKGLKAGKTHIEWVASPDFPGPVQAGFTLEVSVKDEKKVETAFFYVDDGKKQVTKRKITDLDKLLVLVNRILKPQANVVIKRKSAGPLAMTDLGRVVRFAAHLTGPPDNVPAAQDEWDDLLAKRDPTADFNVFFVREYEQDNTPFADNADAGTIAADKMCIFEDKLGHSTEKVLAHESVHALGVSDHSGSRHFLMATGRNGIGQYINRAQADTINPSGT